MSEARRARRATERAHLNALDKVKDGLEERKAEADKQMRLQFLCPSCKLGNTFRVLIGNQSLDVLCIACFVRTPLAQVNQPVQTTKSFGEDLKAKEPS